ncbi:MULTISPECIES: AMP-binding protein [Flavobacterium]|uniref:AMP-binding protein n=1 Tax=Flavobacterium hankyongi TaxID=1176532 RepID=A0ABP9A2V6_9FLAO|nr:AMP-binding protein [Flavobacterium sp. N1846]
MENFHFDIHPNFKLNNERVNIKELLFKADNFISSNIDYQKDIGFFINNWFNKSPYLIVKTSGTTGKSKEIKIEKSAMINSAVATGDFFNLGKGSKALCCLPVKYIAGKMMLVRAMVLGWEIDIVEPSSNPLKGIDKVFDFVAMVPLQVENSLDKLDRVKTLLIGGAPLNKQLSAKLIELRCNAYESYSMTETVTHVALKKVGNKSFRVLSNVKISIDNRNCLIINAPQLNPEELITNDVVDLISEFEFIWKGRIDNVVNSGGIKLFPEQIEEKLVNKIQNRFFVAGVPDEIFNEKLVLFIEGEEFKFDISVFDELDKFEKPKEIFFINKFSETETGKIKRKEIINQFK